MVSKRKFFSIVIMMVVLLFLTQFSMVLRDQANQYDANASLSERKADGKEVIEQSKAERKDLSLLISEKSVLFIGDVSGAMGTEVKRWADYVKWDMFSVKSMDEYIQSKTHLPEMIILESEKYAQGEDLDCLERFQKRGAIIVFGCLEDPALIENNEELQEEILNKGYFAIGRYSDYGVIALKLTDDENKEGEILLFDYETPETEVLAPNFIEFLNQILQNPKPVLQELKGWEKKMYKME